MSSTHTRLAMSLLAAFITSFLVSCGGTKAKPCRTECYQEKGRKICEKRCN